MVDLRRFEAHHPADIDRAVEELQAGRKRTHWMWFVFPQLRVLGRSDTAIHYGIESLDEAVEYLRHPVLGADYRRSVEAVFEQVLRRDVTIASLMGVPDDLKLVSSLTLFGGVAARLGGPEGDELAAMCEQVLAAAAAQGFPRCAATASALAS